MPFNKAPTQLFPNATNGTNTLVLNTSNHASPSLAELTNAEAHITTGDLRKIAYALAEQAYVWHNALAPADRPVAMSVAKASRMILGTNQQRVTYTLQFTVNTSADVADEPA